MISARKINPQDWMRSAETTAVMRVLGGNLTPPQALFVGGCVRNMLLARETSDIDIATIHRPDVVMAMFQKAGIRAIPTGLEHGTVTAIVDDVQFEITTLRKDVETDGRHAVIAFTDRWEEDAQRRDFTINTLLASPNGDVYDPLGSGLSDLEQRKVIFVGEPSQRISEDYLRILRYFRFHGQYGEGAPDAAALAACKDQSDRVSALSKERVTQEFFKILSLPHAADILQLMFDHDVMKDIADTNYRREAMGAMCQLQAKFEVNDTMARLSLLTASDITKIEQWMVLSNAQKQQIEKLMGASIGMDTISKKKIRELVYHFGNAVVMQAYLMNLVLAKNHPDLEIIDIARYWQAPVFPIGGEDMKAAGIMPGRDMGQRLKALELKWIKSDFKKLPKI